MEGPCKLGFNPTLSKNTTMVHNNGFRLLQIGMVLSVEAIKPQNLSLLAVCKIMWNQSSLCNCIIMHQWSIEENLLFQAGECLLLRADKPNSPMTIKVKSM